jgi:hypothetical protein
MDYFCFYSPPDQQIISKKQKVKFRFQKMSFPPDPTLTIRYRTRHSSAQINQRKDNKRTTHGTTDNCTMIRAQAALQDIPRWGFTDTEIGIRDKNKYP